MIVPSADPSVRVSAIVPVLNAMRYLPATIPSFVAAARDAGGVEIICVDNGSTDGSYEYLATLSSEGVRLERRARVTISAVRNFGATLASGQFFSFLDADCLVAPGYFDEAIGALSSSGAAATGFEYALPPEPHWIETTWHTLHYVGRARDVRYLNSGNFVIRREIFEKIGGFREDLRTGEDSELGHRLVRAGHRIFASPSVEALHLGNPRTVRGFYRKNVWHGLGMFGTVNRGELDKPTLMMALHFFNTLIGLLALIAGPFSLPMRVLTIVGLQLLVPAITVAYRAWSVRRPSRLLSGVFLYWVYYWARLHAFFLLLTRKDPNYMK